MSNIEPLGTIFGFPPANDFEVQEVRRIRNLGREWMTDNAQEIDEVEQRSWWKRMQFLSGEDFLLYVYRTAVAGPIVGYGMSTRREEQLYISLAVDPAYHGRGYGTAIYADMFSCAGKDEESMFAVILKNNIASIRAAEKAGFKFHTDDGKTVTYVRAK